MAKSLKMRMLDRGEWISVNKGLIFEYDASTALIIGLFIEQSGFKNEDEWFFKTFDAIRNTIGIKQTTSRRCVRKLINEGILYEKRKGIPCKTWYKFNEKKLFKVLDSYHEKMKKEGK